MLLGDSRILRRIRGTLCEVLVPWRCTLGGDCMVLVTDLFIMSFLPRCAVSPQTRTLDPPEQSRVWLRESRHTALLHRGSTNKQTNWAGGVGMPSFLPPLRPPSLTQFEAAVSLGITAHVVFWKRLVPRVEPGPNDAPWPCHPGRREGRRGGI